LQVRKRERPAASEACDITTLNNKINWHTSLWVTDRRARSRTHDSPGSCEQSPNQSSSFEIDDATFLECLVNDMGSPPELPRHLFSRNTSTPESNIRKADDFSTIKAAKSMPNLPGTTSRRLTVQEKQPPVTPPKSKPAFKNSFMLMLKKSHPMRSDTHACVGH
ncbi:unnamed protein product, partial [Ixodes hexagonus]